MKGVTKRGGSKRVVSCLNAWIIVGYSGFIFVYRDDGNRFTTSGGDR